MFSRPPVTSAARAAVPASAPRVQFDFASFKATDQSAEGGTIARVAYAERAGDATSSALSINQDELVVKGQFLAAGRSGYGGVGVIVSSATGPTDASRYQSLRIRLSAAPGVSTLRVRLVGTDVSAQQSGCYPIVIQAVSSVPTSYDIPLGRFAPESYCGTRGVSSAKTLLQLEGIEVVDAAAPLKARAVQFNVGTISMLE